MTEGVSRRAVLALLSGTGLAVSAPTRTVVKTKPLPRVGEFVRLVDAETDNVIVRLTNLRSSSYLPDPANHFISVRERFLICASDRTGTVCPFQVDLRTGVLRQLAAPRALNPASLCLDEKEKEVYFLDGGELEAVSLATRKSRAIAKSVGAFAPIDANGNFLVVRNGKAEVIAESGEGFSLAEEVAPFCLLRSDRKACVFIREREEGNREFWFVPLSPEGVSKAICVASGRISRPFWSPDNSAVTFLRDVPTPNAVFSELWEAPVTGGGEHKLASTSQFATFSPNEDGSVWVGASRSKAQPDIIIMLRASHRELTLCAHRASHPAAVWPVFSPDSRRIYFQSDHEGKSAVYSVNVELLVEPTAPSA